MRETRIAISVRNDHSFVVELGRSAVRTDATPYDETAHGVMTLGAMMRDAMTLGVMMRWLATVELNDETIWQTTVGTERGGWLGRSSGLRIGVW